MHQNQGEREKQQKIRLKRKITISERNEAIKIQSSFKTFRYYVPASGSYRHKKHWLFLCYKVPEMRFKEENMAGKLCSLFERRVR